MATLESRIIALAEVVGADIKGLTARQGDLSGLTTAQKGSLVAAINELKGLIGSAGAAIDDDAGDGDTAVTWSADKILAVIEAAKAAVTNSLTNGAGAALDTLAELAAALGNDPSFAATIATALGKRVRYDAVQTLTTEEKAQACANLGIGNPDADLVAAYAAAKV